MSFSAAAKTLVERGERCPQCGGELALAPERQPVGVVAQRDSEDSDPPEDGGRFDRE